MEQAKPSKAEKRRLGCLEPLIFVAILAVVFGAMGTVMGAVNMLNTLMQTAYALLIDTVLYIMAVAVLAGALAALLSEFGVITSVNMLLSPLMKPIYGLPGAASVGIMATYFSDNPAILPLANDGKFRQFFKKYQLPALTNIGTAFGMGVIITTFMLGVTGPTGETFGLAILVGNIGAIIGSIISTRLMLRYTAKIYGKEAPCDPLSGEEHEANKPKGERKSVGMRFISAMLVGGKNGVKVGVDIIPGVLIICTLVLMLTNGPSESGVYTGAAYEGVRFLPWVGEKLSFIFTPLFGFTSHESIAVPITALGAAGAAIGIIPKLISAGLAHGQDVAVFIAMCMCWSGYLSTHVAMMDNLKCGELTGKAILCHTIGGLAAGIAAHWIYYFLSMIV